MVSKGITLVMGALALAICGCGNSEPEYKTEGPKASDNASVGQPVGAGGQPAPNDGGISAGKGSAPVGKTGR